METAVVILLILHDESQRKRSSHATSDTSYYFTLLGGEEGGHLRVLNISLVVGKCLLWEVVGRERKQQKGKTRREGQVLYTPFSIYLPWISHWTSFLDTQSFLKASALNFSHKHSSSHQTPATDVCSQKHSEVCIHTFSFKPPNSSQALPVEMHSEKTLHTSPDGANPLERLHEAVCSKAAATMSLWSPEGSTDQAHITWMLTDLQRCSKTCEKSMLQSYWDIWKVQYQKLPLLVEIWMLKGMCQKNPICMLLSFKKTFLFRLTGIYRAKTQTETSDLNFSILQILKCSTWKPSSKI